MKKFSQADKTLNHNLYKHFLEMGIDDGWVFDDKIGNFEIFLKVCEYTNHPIEQSSVLDVGCGTGDFAYFLQQKGVMEYLGVDIFEPAVKKAQEKYPSFSFIDGDFLALDLPAFDFVYSSGALTTQFNSDNYHILEHWLKKMWRLSKKGIVLNVLLKRFPTDTDEILFLYDRKKVLAIAASISNTSNMKFQITDAGCGDGTEELHIFIYR